MTDLNTQPVATTTEAPAQPGAEATSAQNTTPGLDDLLKDFDAQTKPQPAPETQPKAPDPVVADLQRDIAQMKFEKEFEPVRSRIRGDIPKEVLSDDEITDLLDGRAKRDPRLRDAFLNKATNPQKWAEVEKALGSELARKFKARVDAAATADKEAVAAAVRGASSNKAPEEKAPNYGAMTQAEFEREKAKYL